MAEPLMGLDDGGPSAMMVHELSGEVAAANEAKEEAEFLLGGLSRVHPDLPVGNRMTYAVPPYVTVGVLVEALAIVRKRRPEVGDVQMRICGSVLNVFF